MSKDLERFIDGINKDSKKLARDIKRRSIKEIPYTIKDRFLDAKDRFLAYIDDKKNDRAFQKWAIEDYKKYLAMHDESKLDKIDIIKFDNGVGIIVYTDQGPIFRKEERGLRPANVSMYSEAQAKIGLFDSRVTIEGFCYDDVNGVPQVIYAQVTNTIYNGMRGAEEGEVFDPGLSLFQGHKRLPNGKFVKIDEERVCDGGGVEKMFGELNAVFTNKYNQLSSLAGDNPTVYTEKDGELEEYDPEEMGDE